MTPGLIRTFLFIATFVLLIGLLVGMSNLSIQENHQMTQTRQAENATATFGAQQWELQRYFLQMTAVSQPGLGGAAPTPTPGGQQ